MLMLPIMLSIMQCDTVRRRGEMSQRGQQESPGVGQQAPPVAQRPLLCIIAAVSANGVIGAGGRLPWHLPEDLKFFKAQTLGCPVIMGRRTWESIGRPLPGRRNIVVTRNRALQPAGAAVAASLEEAIAQCAGEARVFVIGGADLYRAALPLADRILLTEIRRAYAGDTHFPEFDRRRWRETRREARTSQDGLEFDFVCYERAAQA
jgi:dihydrofolate reductase